MQYMNKAYLLIGGNVGNRLQNLSRAVQLLNAACGTVIQQSAIYETAAWGNTGQDAFYNQALLLTTAFPATRLIHMILAVEEIMGRIRAEKYDPRIIDIDILFYNDEQIQQQDLTIPHPQLQYRRFALVPLQEIAPSLVHPVLHKTIEQLLEECEDTLAVAKVLPVTP
jgi:2-amino-4-hydroxy-6-hydroxymethyldihydropteridine diphosphokinase